jgi:hypothetical protein
MRYSGPVHPFLLASETVAFASSVNANTRRRRPESSGFFQGCTSEYSQISTVRRKLLQFVAAVVLALCVWGHVSELFDHWDNTFKTGNDIEYSTVIVVLIAGAVVGFVRFAVRVLTALLGALHVRPSLPAVVAARPNSTELIGSCPPLPLRI